jgi:hypothetical protein
MFQAGFEEIFTGGENGAGNSFLNVKCLALGKIEG